MEASIIWQMHGVNDIDEDSILLALHGKRDRKKISKNAAGEAGERAQWLRTLAALGKDSCLVPSTDAEAHKWLQFQFQGINPMSSSGHYNHRNPHSSYT